MIAFGELRRLSVQWQTTIDVVERAYALDWLLKGIFDREILQQTLALRGAAALNKAYFTEYPAVQDADFARDAALREDELARELELAAQQAARDSGLSFSLHSVAGTEARFEYTGPLGRRSAAQPLLPLRVPLFQLRLEAARRPLLHPFSDHCEGTVRAAALEELAAERIAALGKQPRARDVFDLWFILTRAREQLDHAATRALTQQIATEKNIPLRATFDAAYRPLLARAWDNALKNVRTRPSFIQAAEEIEARVREMLG